MRGKRYALWLGLKAEFQSQEVVEISRWRTIKGTVIEMYEAAYGYGLSYSLSVSEDGFPVRLGLSVSGSETLLLERRRDGSWLDGSGARLADFDGCTDLDLRFTPLTNTLPIRRLGLEVGESAEISAVWVNAPELTLRRVEQRYTRLKEDVYRYENLSSGYNSEVTVDEDGLVLDYPGAFQRVPLPSEI